MSRIYRKVKVLYNLVQSHNTFVFLDILLIIKRNRFDTTVYRKPSYSGISLNFQSYHPFSQKLSVIYSMVHRACKFCSTTGLLNNELKVIKEILLENDFSPKVIKIHLEKARVKFLTPRPASVDNTKRKQFISLPYIKDF